MAQKPSNNARKKRGISTDPKSASSKLGNKKTAVKKRKNTKTINAFSRPDSRSKARKIAKIILSATAALIIIMAGVLILAGFVPGLSTLAGANKPRDLGIAYTGSDRANARMKSGLLYGSLPSGTKIEDSIKRTGSQPLSNSFTSEELTALMNDRPYKYWPFEEIQVKIDNDNSVEVSGRILGNLLPSYAKAEKIPMALLNEYQSFAPADPVFYVRGKATLKENKISEFKITRLEVGRLRIPVALARRIELSGLKATTIADSKGSAKIGNAEELINNWLNTSSGLYAKEATFHDNQLFYDGSISLQELTVR